MCLMINVRLSLREEERTHGALSLVPAMTTCGRVPSTTSTDPLQPCHTFCQFWLGGEATPCTVAKWKTPLRLLSSPAQGQASVARAPKDCCAPDMRWCSLVVVPTL